MAKKNPRFRHKFSFSGNPEKKSSSPVTRSDIVNSLARQYQAPEHVLEVRESPTMETVQPVEPSASYVASRRGRSKLWMAIPTLIGASAALWISGLLPAPVASMGDSVTDYAVSKAISLGPILWGEIATIGFVIIVLGRHMRHGSSPDAVESG